MQRLCLRGTSFALRRQRLKSRTDGFYYRRKTGAAFRGNRCVDRIPYRRRPKSKENRANSSRIDRRLLAICRNTTDENSDFFFGVPDAKVRPARSSRRRSMSRTVQNVLFCGRGGRKPPRVIYLFFREQTRKVRFGAALPQRASAQQNTP